jgi:hypothetical protein
MYSPTASPTRSTPPSPGLARLWKAAQATALLVTVVLLVGLIIQPEPSLKFAWFAIVPLLPASFLINAGLWRGVCPIATANTIWSREDARIPGKTWARHAPVTGVVLLFVLVPARHLILNVNGPVLAGTLAAIVAGALGLGWVFRTKAGFCNSLCPVLPVEKIYGQSPLVYIQNPRCLPCNHCSVKGCLDLSPPAAVSKKNGQGEGRAWMKTPMGLFSAAFPGLVIGYFLVDDGSLADWLGAYGYALIGAAMSAIILGGAVVVARVHARRAAPVLAALAVGAYYWFAAPASVAAFEGPAALGLGLRWALLALVLFWLFKALERAD